MKKICILLVLVGLLSVALFGCSESPAQPKNIMSDFSDVVRDGCPDDLRLTIYYMPYSIVTRKPLTVEELITHSSVEIIQVPHEEIVEHFSKIQELATTQLDPIEGETQVAGKDFNVRMCCVFETGEKKILKMAFDYQKKDVLVNGVAVEGDLVFRECIEPFLTEEALAALADGGKSDVISTPSEDG